MVQNNPINLNWISGNENIDNFIQEMQLKINDHNDIVFEWIPYNQFNEIKEKGKNNSIPVYSAIWTNGPLYCDRENKKYARGSNRKVALICLNNSQNLTEFLINEV